MSVEIQDMVNGHIGELVSSPEDTRNRAHQAGRITVKERIVALNTPLQKLLLDIFTTANEFIGLDPARADSKSWIDGNGKEYRYYPGQDVLERQDQYLSVEDRERYAEAERIRQDDAPNPDGNNGWFRRFLDPKV